MFTYNIVDERGYIVCSPLFPVSSWNTPEEATYEAQRALERLIETRKPLYRTPVSYEICETDTQVP